MKLAGCKLLNLKTKNYENIQHEPSFVFDLNNAIGQLQEPGKFPVLA